MIHISSDFSEIDREIKRLSKIPNSIDRQRLNGVLKRAEAAVEGAIHVETGSLKSSVASSSSYDRAFRTWEGNIVVGGASGGVNNPVDYAIYEQRRDGGHDFMLVLNAFHADWVAAIRGALS